MRLRWGVLAESASGQIWVTFDDDLRDEFDVLPDDYPQSSGSYGPLLAIKRFKIVLSTVVPTF